MQEMTSVSVVVVVVVVGRGAAGADLVSYSLPPTLGPPAIASCRGGCQHWALSFQVYFSHFR